MNSTSLRHRIATLAAALVIAPALASCGGGDDKPAGDGTETASNPAVGAYELTTEITESTIKTNQAGPKSKQTRTIFVSCADAECTRLFQRGAAPKRLQSLTVELAPASGEGSYSGSWSTARACPTDPKLDYSEEIAWSWTRAEDGVLTGTIEQTAVGCKVDGTATYEMTAKPLPETPLPYLETIATEDLVAAYTTYDAALGKARDAYTKCQDDEQDTYSVDDAKCDAAFYRTLSTGVTALGTAIDALEEPATGPCHDAVADVMPTAWAAKFTALAKVAAQATTTAGLKKAFNQNDASTDFTTARYDAVLQVAAMCVDPTEATSFGEGGKLLLDPGQVLVPKL